MPIREPVAFTTTMGLVHGNPDAEDLRKVFRALRRA